MSTSVILRYDPKKFLVLIRLTRKTRRTVFDSKDEFRYFSLHQINTFAYGRVVGPPSTSYPQNKPGPNIVSPRDLKALGVFAEFIYNTFAQDVF